MGQNAPGKSALPGCPERRSERVLLTKIRTVSGRRVRIPGESEREWPDWEPRASLNAEAGRTGENGETLKSMAISAQFARAHVDRGR